MSLFRATSIEEFYCVDRPAPRLAVGDLDREIAANPGNAPEQSLVDNLIENLRIPAPEAAVLVLGKKWTPGQTLTVSFLSGTEDQRRQVREGVAVLEQYANIDFKFIGVNTRGTIRVGFDPDLGSWSAIGRDALRYPSNVATMNFGWLDVRVILHEFFHGLGFGHEQSTPNVELPWNKPVVYDAYAGPPNRWDKAKVDHNVFFKYARHLVNASKYDPKSISHYPIPAKFLLDASFAVGLNRELSAGDIAALKRHYPKPQREAA